MTTTFYTTAAADQLRSFMPATPIMLTATSHFRIGQRREKWRNSGAIPPVTSLPEQITEVAADAGGFEAHRKYGGCYPFTWQAYTAWLASIPNLTWAAMPDLPCEIALASDAAAVRARQVQTWDNAWHFIMFRRHVSWAWVPTIQGRNVDEYVWHARYQQYRLLDLPLGDWETFRQGSAHPDFRVGIGSLCKRESTEEIVDIVSAVVDVLGKYGFRFHLWGVKLNAAAALRRAGLLPYIASLDSAAWNNRFGRDIERQKSSGMDQRRYAWTVAWPAYTATLRAALSPGPASRQSRLPLAS